MFNFFNKTDEEVRRDVLNELMWDPSLNAGKVNVTANNGVITLTGTVPHFIERVAAEKAAQRVGGVRGVADELEVKGTFAKTDEEIVAAALNAIKWNYSVPNNVKIIVDKGWLTLSGEVDWDYQRAAAESAVCDLLGVTGVMNNISIKSKIQPSDIKTRIEDALKRSAQAEGRKISVSVKGDTVTLTGNVHSFSEKAVARHAAWMAPGVSMVINDLVISQ